MGAEAGHSDCRYRQPVQLQNDSHFDNNFQHILLQTREFIFYETNTERILDYLRKNDVISVQVDRELMRCATQQDMCEHLLDVILNKGQKEFHVLCDALRKVEKQEYLADLLLALDKLMYQFTPLHECKACSECSSPNETESMTANKSLDINILYFDLESRELQPIKNVANIKEKVKNIISTRSANDSFIDQKDLENAKKLIPVISLGIYYNCLFNAKMETLAKFLEQHQCIKELLLAKNHMDNVSLERLGKALAKNQGLLKIDLRLNTIDNGSASHLSNGYQRNVLLQTMTLASTDLTGLGCNLFTEKLSHIQELCEIDFSFNNISDEGCKGVSELLSRNTALKRLRLRDNNISTFGASRVFKSLRKNSRLTTLDLSNNDIGNKSICILSEILLHNRSLTDLNLEKCNITSEACISLARCLKTNTRLKWIELSMNPLKDQGAIALSDGLKYNHVIETICINLCQIRNDGFSSILDALRTNRSVSLLKMCYNLIGPTTKENSVQWKINGMNENSLYNQLCEVLQSNKALRIILWGNKFEVDEWSQQLYQIL